MLLPFSPPAGLNSNDTTFAAEGQWADGNETRFHQGKAQPTGGTEQLHTLANGGCKDIFAFVRAGAVMVAYGCGSGQLFIGTGLGSPVDRAPASVPNTDSGWSFAQWGDTLLGAPIGGTIYDQSGTGDYAEVTAAPNRIDAGIMVTQQRQVLAFGANEEISGTHNPLCIRGSDIEDYTDWSTTSTNNAFEHIISDGGAIVAKAQVGNYVAVWTQTGLYIGTFLGDPAQTYDFEKVADDCGPVNRRSVCVLNGTAYWMGKDHQLRTWTPGGLVTVIPSPISQTFEANCDMASQVLNGFIHTNTKFQEIWFYYTDIRDSVDDGASRYVAYSLTESATAGRPIWFRGVRNRITVAESDLLRTISGVLTSLLGVDDDRKLYKEDLVGFVMGGYIQSADLYLDNSQRRAMIRRLIPDFGVATTGSVTVNLYMRDRPESTAVTKGPYTVSFDPGSLTTKVDFRASGKIMAARITTGVVAWRLGKLLFDTVALGER